MSYGTLEKANISNKYNTYPLLRFCVPIIISFLTSAVPLDDNNPKVGRILAPPPKVPRQQTKKLQPYLSEEPK